MKINANGISVTPPVKRSTRPALTPSSGDSFENSNALDGALKTVPDVRSKAVDRARQLINDPNYPSADTVKKLSSFLADKLQSNQE